MPIIMNCLRQTFALKLETTGVVIKEFDIPLDDFRMLEKECEHYNYVKDKRLPVMPENSLILDGVLIRGRETPRLILNEADKDKRRKRLYELLAAPVGIDPIKLKPPEWPEPKGDIPHSQRKFIREVVTPPELMLVNIQMSSDEPYVAPLPKEEQPEKWYQNHAFLTISRVTLLSAAMLYVMGKLILYFIEF